MPGAGSSCGTHTVAGATDRFSCEQEQGECLVRGSGQGGEGGWVTV